MLHEHLFYFSRSPRITGFPNVIGYENHSNGVVFLPVMYPRLYLSAGVTSARTAGTIAPRIDMKIKRDIDSGSEIGPDFGLTVFVSDYAGDKVKDAEEMRERVRYWAKQGITGIKLYVSNTPDQSAVAIEEARKYGVSVTGHLCATSLREAADLGINQLEHGLSSICLDFNPA
jgi:hypothetical protein